MNSAKYVNIARLITAYNLEINNEVLPDNLKCAKCKLVLKDACLVPCGCKFCRACIDDLMVSGSEFCPGVSEDCEESILSDFATDYRVNKIVSKLTVKCPHDGCLHQCQLARLEEHMRVCGRKSVACPFHELGCQHDKFPAEEMKGHFQQENGSHCEILIRMIADIKMEMESRKREIEILTRSDEDRKIEIEMLKSSDKRSKNEIEMLKHELVLKDGQIRTIIDQMEHVQNENKSLKQEIKSIKEEKADLADRVRILSEKIDREIDEMRESGERDNTNVIEHIDTEITAITAVVKSVNDDIRSINHDGIKSIKDDTDRMKSQIQSIQKLVGPGQVDASCEWTIDHDFQMLYMKTVNKMSGYFSGAVYPYKYRLAADIIGSRNLGGSLWMYLRIYRGSSDSQLPWPFMGTVTIMVEDTGKSHKGQTNTKKREISNPADKSYTYGGPFIYELSSLFSYGHDLSRGARVSCVIVPYGSFL